MRYGKFPKPQIAIDEFGPSDARVRARWTDPADTHRPEELTYIVEVRVTDRMIKPYFGLCAKAAYTVEEIDRVIEILSRARDRAVGLRKPEPDEFALRLT